MTDALLDTAASRRPGSAGLDARRHAPGSWCEHESRTRLLDLSVGLVEDLQCEGVHPGKGPEGFCGDFQICLPYRGLFVWHVGTDDVVGDLNQVVFVRAGEAYRMSGAGCPGYAELILTPDPDVLSELAHVNGHPLSQHPLFRRRARLADPALQTFRARFLHWSRQATGDDRLQAEELVVALLRAALHSSARGATANGASTNRLIRRTKEFLEANLSGRVRLADAARAVGASPAYLTDLFSRVEGVSLHQYLTRLRLGRALVELPHTTDLTALALDLGFSSHSHFSSVFRRAYGCTPSAFREGAPAVRPSPAIRLMSPRAAADPQAVPEGM